MYNRFCSVCKQFKHIKDAVCPVKSDVAYPVSSLQAKVARMRIIITRKLSFIFIVIELCLRFTNIDGITA